MKKKLLKTLVERCWRFCCPDGKANEQRIIQVIKNLKSLPRHQALFAVSEFLKALKKQKDQTTLIVESANSLSKAELSSIARKLKGDFTIMEVKNIVNPELLAGFKIRIADSLSDFSLQGRIAQLKEAVVT